MLHFSICVVFGMNFQQQLNLINDHGYANMRVRNVVARLENDNDVADARMQRQRQLNAERQRVRRANENNLDAQRRREHAAEHNRVNRVNEVPQQAAARRRVELVRHQARAPRMLNLARINDQNILPVRHTLGEFNVPCAHCRALKFVNEKNFKCCCEGKVSLPDLLEFPEQLRNFLSSNSA